MFDIAAAEHAADLMASRRLKGRAGEYRDTMIAGIALATGATLKMQDGTYVWKAAVESFELAKSKVEELATNAPGEYTIFSQTTGNKIVVNPDGLPEPGPRQDSR